MGVNYDGVAVVGCIYSINRHLSTAGNYRIFLLDFKSKFFLFALFYTFIGQKTIM